MSAWTRFVAWPHVRIDQQSTGGVRPSLALFVDSEWKPGTPWVTLGHPWPYCASHGDSHTTSVTLKAKEEMAAVKAVAVAPGRQGRATRPEVPARRAIRGAKRQEAQDAGSSEASVCEQCEECGLSCRACERSRCPSPSPSASSLDTLRRVANSTELLASFVLGANACHYCVHWRHHGPFNGLRWHPEAHFHRGAHLLPAARGQSKPWVGDTGIRLMLACLHAVQCIVAQGTPRTQALAKSSV